jgi:hypothetical protein
MPRRPRPRRGLRAGHVRKGCPGTWEVCSSPLESSVGGPKTKSQAAVVCVLHYEQSESSSAPKRYRQAKETKRGGMGGQKSE